MAKTAKKFTDHNGTVGRIGSKVIDYNYCIIESVEDAIERRPEIIETVIEIYRQGAAGTKIKTENAKGEKKLVTGKYHVIIE